MLQVSWTKKARWRPQQRPRQLLALGAARCFVSFHIHFFLVNFVSLFVALIIIVLDKDHDLMNDCIRDRFHLALPRHQLIGFCGEISRCRLPFVIEYVLQAGHVGAGQAAFLFLRLLLHVVQGLAVLRLVYVVLCIFSLLNYGL